MLTFNNMDGGAKATDDPPGFESGDCPQHHQRGHLIGNDLGGSGKNPNLVTLTEGTNHPVMYEFEQAVKKLVSLNPTATFLYEVRVDYIQQDYFGDGVRFGVQGNPYCVFPAPSRLRLYLKNEHGVSVLPQKIPELSNDGEGGLIVQNGTYKFHYGHVNHTKNDCWAGKRETDGAVCAKCQKMRTDSSSYFDRWHFCPNCHMGFCGTCGGAFSSPNPFLDRTRFCPNPQCKRIVMVLW
jgi:hypothetical protein